MHSPCAAAIPARSAAPYPRSLTATTRAPCASAISIDPSVDPLSATSTSPRSPAARNAATALSTQNASEFASFKHGSTTVTSSATAPSASPSAPRPKISVVAISSNIISAIARFAQRTQAHLECGGLTPLSQPQHHHQRKHPSTTLDQGCSAQKTPSRRHSPHIANPKSFQLCE